MSKAKANEKLKIEKMTSEKKRQAVKSMKDIRERHKTEKDEKNSTEIIRYFRKRL